jgi:hypothetical protein
MSNLTPSLYFESLGICVVWIMAISTLYFDLGRELLKFGEADIFAKAGNVSKFDELRKDNWKAFRYLILLSKVHFERKRLEIVQKYSMVIVVGLLLLIVIFMLSERNAADVAWVKLIATISVAAMTLIVKWRMWLLNARINRA